MLTRYLGRLQLTTVLALCLLSCTTSVSMAQFPEMLSKAPESPNAMALFDVQKLRKYAQKSNDEDAKNIREVLKGVSAELSNSINKIALLSSVNFDTMDTAWELGVIEFAKMPSVEEIARIENGYVEVIEGRSVIFSNRNSYMIPTQTPNVMATVKPANRQLLKRWLKVVDADKASGLPGYLKEAAEYAGDDVPIVMAVDLADAVSPTMVKARLKTLNALANGADLPAIEKLVSDIRGVIFAVQLNEGFKGRVRVDFSESAAPLEAVGQKMLSEVLERRDVLFQDISQWKASAKGNSFSVLGNLTPEGLSNVLNFHRTTQSVGSLSSMHEAIERAPSKSPEQLTIAASQEYFRATKKIITDVRTFKAQTMGQKATMNERGARRIGDLPMLNVDEQLISYGSEVASLLMGSGTEIRSANMAAGTQKAGQSRTQWGGGYGYGASYNSANPGIAQANAQATERGMTSHLGNLKTIEELTQRVRADMVRKYKVEF